VTRRSYLERQKYAECQLVSAINAAIHLGEPRVDPRSEEYERLVDLVGARHGSAIQIERAHRYLRLVREPLVPLSWDRVQGALLMGYPVEVTALHKTRGFHSGLSTAFKARGRKLLLRNWASHGGSEWVSWDALRGCLKAGYEGGALAWWFRPQTPPGTMPSRTREEATT
jgi:hypothetical protein